MGGTLREEWERREGDCPAHWGRGSLLGSQFDALQSKAPSRPHGSWGIGGRPGRPGEAGGRGPAGGAGEERGCLPHPLRPSKPARVPGEVPCPLRPGWGASLGLFSSLSLSSTSHSPQGLFQSWGS